MLSDPLPGFMGKVAVIFAFYLPIRSARVQICPPPDLPARAGTSLMLFVKVPVRGVKIN